jgi:hypothetical protein
MAGYSGTPLAKKLSIKAGFTVFAIGGPADYASLLEPLPDDVKFVNKLTKAVDLIHLFTKSAAELDARLSVWRHAMKSDGTIWAKEGIEGADRHHRGCDPRGRAANGSRRYEGLRRGRDVVGIEADGAEGIAGGVILSHFAAPATAVIPRDSME